MDRPEPGLIRWSPNPTRESFLHMNLQHRVIRLYEPTGHAQRGKFSYQKLSQHDDFPPLTTYDWSPAVSGLVAVGTSSGIVNLLRVDDNANSYLELPIKVARTCQAVAFNTAGSLAVGLDRVRSDACLYVWDVERLGSFAGKKDGFPDVPFSSRNLEPSVSVSSIRFFEDNPRTLVVGIKQQGLRIHDLREPGAVMNFQTKCNNNLAIDYADPNYFASSALDLPGVMVWDRRATSRAVASPGYLDAIDQQDPMPWGGALRLDQALQLEADPAIADNKNSFIRSLRFCRDRPGLLAVLSRTGQLKVFSTKLEYERPDRRSEDGPQLREVRTSHEMDPVYAETGRKNDRIVSFDWVTLQSPLLRPRMVVLRASGAFDIVETPSHTSDYLYQLVPWQAPYRGLEEGTSYHTPMELEPPHDAAVYGPLVVEQALADVALFGPEKPSVGRVAQEAVLRMNGKMSEMLSDGKPQANGPVHSFSDGATIADKLKELRHEKSSTETHDRTNGHRPNGSKAVLKDLSTHRHRHHSLLGSAHAPTHRSTEAQAVLDHIMLLRAKEKYLFDATVNQRVLSDDPWLQCVWSWVADAEDAAEDGGMMCSPLDLSYLGVYTIWGNDLGSKPAARLADGAAEPNERGWERCLEAIGKKRGVADFAGAATARPQHRRLCLDISRWGGARNVDLSASDQSMDLERASSMRTRAAAQAMFRGDLKEAVHVLQKASTTHPELLFVALAIQLMSKGPGQANSTDQLDFDERVASRTDPYLRAISSLIATGDWTTIANQRSLPMRDRVFVAVKYFSDDALTAWLEKEVAQAAETGDAEGIVLTGITDGMVDILATFVQKFMDYQTAALLLSVCAPRYIDDIRCTAMRDAYRAYLQRHRAFFERCKFEVESTKRSKSNGVPTIKPPGRQIALRCVYCEAETSLEKYQQMGPQRLPGALSPLPGSGHGPPATGSGPTGAQSNPFTEKMVRAGISCPNCKCHLPRCVVCLEVVGMPRSDRPELSSDADIRLAARFPTFCLKCEHVLHLDHARQWFARHQECPVPECRCKCNFRANPDLSYH